MLHINDLKENIRFVLLQKENETKATTATKNVEYKYTRENGSCKNKHSQLTFPCSNWTRETLEKAVKYVQS